LVSCGAENTKGCVIRATSCDSLTVVGLHAKPITGAAYGGTQAVRWIDGTKATFIGCDYDAVTSAGTLYNLVLQGGSHLTDINEGTAVSGGNGFVGYGGSSTWTKWASGALQIAGATPSVPASHVGLGATTSTTVGAAGGASALPATPSGYLTVNIGGTAYKVPYFAS
jgi:hypothetical protein